MTKVGTTHDISFVEPTNSKEIGLMLDWRTNSQGVRQYPYYSEYDDPALSQQYYSGEPSYANLPPEKELQIAQDDWRSGVGLEIFDSADDKRYWESINMDLRFKGMAQCGPLATAITKPAGVVRAWAEFNGKIYIGVNNILGKLNTSTDVFDTVHTFSATVGSAVQTSGSGLSDITTGGTFSYGGVERFEIKISTAGTPDKFRWRYKAYTSGGTKYGSWSSEVSITGAAQTLQDGVTITFAAITGHTADDTWVVMANHSANITDLKSFAFVNSSGIRMEYLFIALGDYAAFNYMTTGESFTISLLNSYDDFGACRVNLFRPVGTTLWASGAFSLGVRSSTDPTNDGSFSTPTYIGGSYTDSITALLNQDGALIVVKEDMVYYIDTDGNPQELINMQALQRAASPYSGANSLVWGRNAYFPCGAQSLIQYDGTDATFIDPAEKCNSLTEFTGQVQALVGDDRYLYAITDNSTKVEVMATRDEVIDGSTTRVWHPLAELTLAGCQIAFMSSIHKKRLYVASTSADDSFYYYPLPTDYGDPDSDSNYTFQTDGYFITPWLHANFKADNKAFIKLTLTMADTSDTEYFTAYYRLKGTDSWTEIGDFKTEPTTTKYLAAAGTSRSGIMIQFKFAAVTGDSSTTPKLLGYDCRGIWYPTKRRLINCRVRIADDALGKKTGVETQTAAQIRTAIDAANDASWPITFYDPWGNTNYVKFLTVTKQATALEKGRNLEEVYELTLEKVALA